MTKAVEKTIRRTAQVASWMLLSVIVYATLTPLAHRPGTGFVSPERFGAFALTGAAFTIGYPRRWPSVLFGLLVGAAALEAMQCLLPDRHGRLADLAIKSAGLVSGVMLGRVGERAARTRAGARQPGTGVFAGVAVLEGVRFSGLLRLIIERVRVRHLLQAGDPGRHGQSQLAAQAAGCEVEDTFSPELVGQRALDHLRSEAAPDR